MTVKRVKVRKPDGTIEEQDWVEIKLEQIEKQERIGWTHPLFITILVLSLLAVVLAIWVRPAKSQTIDTTWQDPLGWEIASLYHAEFEMQKFYDFQAQYPEVIWDAAMDMGYFKHWLFIDAVGHEYYWGFNINVPDGHVLTWGPQSQLEVLVETHDGSQLTYESSGWIISRGQGYTTWLGGRDSYQAVRIQNGVYDGRNNHTRVMCRFRWDERPRRIISYRVRGVHYK